MSTHDPQIGAVLAGKYRVERVLGQGGMGVVVEATQLDLERRVALKFLRHAASPETSLAHARFEREARTVARLRGAHIVKVYDVGKLEQGQPFIVMELLEGEDLSAVLDREQRLPVSTAVDYILQTCEAMAEAHAAGVVHRDLKPANLFVELGADRRPLIKVLDFGISKLMSAEASQPSITGGALGSPLYMSPEQLSSSKTIDHRTDVWSLGAILYELVTGTPAFHAEGVPQICTRIILEEPQPPSELSSEVPAELEHVILACLRKLPLERCPTVADLALALLPFGRKSSQVHVEATLRIVRGSSLPHGRLPDALDTLPPPPPLSPLPRLSSLPEVPAHPDWLSSVLRPQAPPGNQTVDLGGVTHSEPTLGAPPARRTLSARVGLAGGAALALALALFFVQRAWPPSSPLPPRSAQASVARPTAAAPTPSPSVVALSVGKPEALGSSAPIASRRVGAGLRPPPPRKPSPQPPSEPSPEELLKHR